MPACDLSPLNSSSSAKGTGSPLRCLNNSNTEVSPDSAPQDHPKRKVAVFVIGAIAMVFGSIIGWLLAGGGGNSNPPIENLWDFVNIRP